ncbi:MAG: cupin domain-containing protein [Candidatus Nomurabacteria bacterium]|jgi:mannose-6-phosphate isomerase-like protein (cupin superfamily)|nr:cupin domain-containing protein [Candidatus Nomurabacteria bacterium]
MMKYVYHKSDAETVVKHKHGVDITVYAKPGVLLPNVVYEETEIGHLQEWYSDKSTQTWYIIEGEGVFVLDGEKFKVGAGDLVAVPPKVKKYYYGKMKMVLVTSPGYDPDDEHKVRTISEEEL